MDRVTLDSEIMVRIAALASSFRGLQIVPPKYIIPRSFPIPSSQLCS